MTRLRVHHLLLTAALSVLGLGGCGGNEQQSTTVPTVAGPTLEEEWALQRETLLAEANAMIAGGQFGQALGLLQRFHSVVDPELQALVRTASIGQVREEASALESDALDDRRRVYSRWTMLDPSDTQAAKEYERVIATISKVPTLSDKKLCAKLGNVSPDRVYLDEYKRRGGIPFDFQYIGRGQIQIGMSEMGLKCAWRKPDDVNVTVFQGLDGTQQVHKQYVFGDNYVYTENGKITAVQQ